MLIYIDILIGVAVIMLGCSLMLTIANQFLASLFAVRGTNLKWGLAVLIQELHPGQFNPPSSSVPILGNDLNPKAEAVAQKILSHRLLSDSKIPIGRWKLATAIRFEELLKIVDLIGKSDTGDIGWLRANNKITESWFNTIMDRVTQRFAMHMRLYSLVLASVAVLLTGVDTLHMVNVLKNDATIRSGLVATADTLSKSNSVDTQDQTKLRELTKSVVAQLPSNQTLKAILIPDSGPSFPGALISIVLMSLGAPFWFNTLKNLVNLRSIVAKREEDERTEKTPAAADARGIITWNDKAAHA
jgi:hypothetical protein